MRRAAPAGAVVFLLPWDGTHGAAHDAARAAPRLAAPRSHPAIAPEIVTRPWPEPASPGWTHQAYTPLPTEGFLAMRAATAAYRQLP